MVGECLADNSREYTTQDLSEFSLRKSSAVNRVARLEKIGSKRVVLHGGWQSPKFFFNENEKQKLLKIFYIPSNLLSLVAKKDPYYGDIVYATMENNGEIDIERYISLSDAERISGIKLGTWWARIYNDKKCKGLRLTKNYILYEDFLKFCAPQPQGLGIEKMVEESRVCYATVYNLVNQGLINPDVKVNSRKVYSSMDIEILKETFGKHLANKLKISRDIYQRHLNENPEKYQKIIDKLTQDIESILIKDEIKKNIIAQKRKRKMELKELEKIRKKVKRKRQKQISYMDEDQYYRRLEYENLISGVFEDINSGRVSEYSMRLKEKLEYTNKFIGMQVKPYLIAEVYKACLSLAKEPLYFSNLLGNVDKLHGTSLDNLLEFLVVLGNNV